MGIKRFKLEKSVHPGKWVCTDIVNGIVCVFEEHRLNDTQKFTVLDDVKQSDTSKLISIANEMGEWLRNNHYDKIF